MLIFKMSKQRLIQKSQLKVTPQQIQFLNLLQTPLVSIDRIIEKELENNPCLLYTSDAADE